MPMSDCISNNVTLNGPFSIKNSCKIPEVWEYSQSVNKWCWYCIISVSTHYFVSICEQWYPAYSGMIQRDWLLSMDCLLYSVSAGAVGPAKPHIKPPESAIKVVISYSTILLSPQVLLIATHTNYDINLLAKGIFFLLRDIFASTVRHWLSITVVSIAS